VLFEPQASFVWFSQRSHLSGRRGTQHTKAVLVPFSAWAKGAQAILIARRKEQYKLKEGFATIPLAFVI